MDVGAVINQYTVIEHIGRGGMADVWSARDKRLSRTVAIKTIARGLSEDVDPIRLFEREAKTIAQLEHPHILPIYDFGEFDEQLYIVMRYVSGGSLEDWLEDGPMSIDEMLRMAQAVAEALDYAHTNKVVHLDLKPPNILLDSHRAPYLADFGLAAVMGPEGRVLNPGSGTLLYMAPEQLTSDVLDHRADIYSFAIMIFHMLTGKLPFDATTPLALRQLQMGDSLPDITEIEPNLPPIVTAILRRGTAIEASDRPSTLMELVTELQNALTEGRTQSFSERRPGFDDEIGMLDVGRLITESMSGPQDMALLEAEDIYNRARNAWARGQGRFLLGVTHFMLVNDYYKDAEGYELELDDAGKQMLMRGALEYDTDIEFWWSQLAADDRRWVALHAVRSENAPARMRALYRLEALPDSDPPQIPKLVAQALQVETNEAAQIAAIQVLGTRAQLMEVRDEYTVKEAVEGHLLTTMTRLVIQRREPSDWRTVVYSPQIDGLLADIALEFGAPKVAEQAARTIGRIRSLEAVKQIAEEQRKGTRGALRALALVRDEAPSLPSIVSPQARTYAWLANTWRRIADDPMQSVWRFMFALIGGWLGMGMNVFTIFRSEAIFNQQRWANAITMGLLFGLLVAVLVLVAGQFPSRLRGFWSNYARLILGGVVGALWGTFTWWSYHWFFLNNANPGQSTIFFGGFGLALGFLLTAMLKLRGWLAVLVTTVAIYIPIYITYRSYMFYDFPENFNFLNYFSDALIYYDSITFPEHIFTVALPFAILLALGGHAQALYHDLRQVIALTRRTFTRGDQGRAQVTGEFEEAQLRREKRLTAEIPPLGGARNTVPHLTAADLMLQDEEDDVLASIVKETRELRPQAPGARPTVVTPPPTVAVKSPEKYGSETAQYDSNEILGTGSRPGTRVPLSDDRVYHMETERYFENEILYDDDTTEMTSAERETNDQSVREMAVLTDAGAIDEDDILSSIITGTEQLRSDLRTQSNSGDEAVDDEDDILSSIITETQQIRDSHRPNLETGDDESPSDDDKKPKR
ncbi:MAG: protein kinase [Burkholderiales bacterium]|nr:protein kinase [Anaerolineae bacterium]